MTADFRCSVASEDLAEPVAGTASTVRAFLLVEAPGPWGVDAVSGSRLPEEVKAHLRTLARSHRVRPLMIRGHGRHRSGRARVFAASVGGPHPRTETALLSDVRELLDLPLTGLADGVSPGLAPYDEPLLCVCTHGRHDACCAERGRPLCKALHAVAPEHTWEVSHIGGDRFAPNVLVLPDGLYYGRLSPSSAADLVETVRSGRLDLEHLRGRCAFPFAVQAAEVFLRRELGLFDAAPPMLHGHSRDGSLVQVRFGLGDSDWEVSLRSEPAEPRQLTCRAAALGVGLRHTLLAFRQVSQ